MENARNRAILSNLPSIFVHSVCVCMCVLILCDLNKKAYRSNTVWWRCWYGCPLAIEPLRQELMVSSQLQDFTKRCWFLLANHPFVPANSITSITHSMHSTPPPSSTVSNAQSLQHPSTESIQSKQEERMVLKAITHYWHILPLTSWNERMGSMQTHHPMMPHGASSYESTMHESRQ